MWTTFNFRVRVKTNKIYSRYLREDPRYRFWTRLLSWFRPCFRNRKNKIYIGLFPVSRIFSGKADSVIFLCLECTINPQNLIKIVGAIFEKIQILNFFLMWTTLNFRGSEKTKKRLEIFTRGPWISNLKDIGLLV